MPLVAAKCTQCGAVVQVDNNQKAAICEHCGMAYVVEDAITNYNVKLHADNITVQMDGSLENRLKAGYARFSMGDYREAYEIFSNLVDACPYDCRGWIGLAKVGLFCQRFKRYRDEIYIGTGYRDVDILSNSALGYYQERVEKARIMAEQNDQMDIFNKHKPELERIASELDKLLTFNNEIKQTEEEIRDDGNHVDDSDIGCALPFFLFLVLEFLLFCAGVAYGINEEFGIVNARNYFVFENWDKYGAAHGAVFAVGGIIPVIIIVWKLYSFLDHITGKAKVRKEKVQEIEKKEQAVKDNKEKLEQQRTKLAESIRENFINL